MFIQLADFMPVFIRLDELFIPLVEFLLIFKLLAESIQIYIHAEDFRVMHGLQIVDLPFPSLFPT